MPHNQLMKPAVKPPAPATLEELQDLLLSLDPSDGYNTRIVETRTGWAVELYFSLNGDMAILPSMQKSIVLKRFLRSDPSGYATAQKYKLLYETFCAFVNSLGSAADITEAAQQFSYVAGDFGFNLYGSTLTEFSTNECGYEFVAAVPNTNMCVVWEHGVDIRVETYESEDASPTDG